MSDEPVMRHDLFDPAYYHGPAPVPTAPVRDDSPVVVDAPPAVGVFDAPPEPAPVRRRRSS